MEGIRKSIEKTSGFDIYNVQVPAVFSGGLTRISFIEEWSSQGDLSGLVV